MAAWILVGAGAVAAQAAPDELVPLGDQLPVPQRAVLVGQRHQLAGRAHAGRSARLGEQQQREQPEHLGLVGHQVGERPRQPDRLRGEVGAQQWPRRRGVALVEDQVQHGQHRRQPVGELRLAGHPVGDAGVADLLLGPHDALRDGRLGRDVGAGDLGHLQPAEQAEGERGLGERRERRVAAGEDQSQLVVAHRSRLLLRLVGVVQQQGLRVPGLAGGLAADPVDRAVAGGGDDPGARVGREHVPALHRHRERVLHGLLGEPDVAEEACQGGDAAAVLGPVDARQVHGSRSGEAVEGPDLDRRLAGLGGTSRPRPARRRGRRRR